jgi:DNA replication and repair protein RecF
MLDDLPAELDYEHRGQVVSCLDGLGCQYFMTGVDKKDFEELVVGIAHKMFHVEHGVASVG